MVMRSIGRGGSNAVRGDAFCRDLPAWAPAPPLRGRTEFDCVRRLDLWMTPARPLAGVGG